jgi:hypothetical protein
VLDSSKADGYGLTMRQWREALDAYLVELN